MARFSSSFFFLFPFLIASFSQPFFLAFFFSIVVVLSASASQKSLSSLLSLNRRRRRRTGEAPPPPPPLLFAAPSLSPPIRRKRRPKKAASLRSPSLTRKVCSPSLPSVAFPPPATPAASLYTIPPRRGEDPGAAWHTHTHTPTKKREKGPSSFRTVSPGKRERDDRKALSLSLFWATFPSSCAKPPSPPPPFCNQRSGHYESARMWYVVVATAAHFSFLYICMCAHFFSPPHLSFCVCMYARLPPPLSLHRLTARLSLTFASSPSSSPFRLQCAPHSCLPLPLPSFKLLFLPGIAPPSSSSFPLSCAMVSSSSSPSSPCMTSTLSLNVPHTRR